MKPTDRPFNPAAYCLSYQPRSFLSTLSTHQPTDHPMNPVTSLPPCQPLSLRSTLSILEPSVRPFNPTALCPTPPNHTRNRECGSGGKNCVFILYCICRFRRWDGCADRNTDPSHLLECLQYRLQKYLRLSHIHNTVCSYPTCFLKYLIVPRVICITVLPCFIMCITAPRVSSNA